ncbi:MAG: 30S ribosomal protein S30e [Thaumarchaeota archaeon]|jgi:small subunit ribosomal protein S30e|nr:30S ribosomal protein S30e [Candidatus Geocrenenecus arthurdayi]MCL7389093.1 30S ribosomal protein S30e [Candidatus Geocrenenecus arthurdayi]MCL7391133.1 30S ribosomal protein S30e [Candidatus Geocrenenecus arthurdayi]MCL7396744.1 30S ribosomal protein S30e [Candidatus Geocrenenecus arthurdayi]MCL7403592.1 30S ribosomal protein S30e [Candidatus Geocrenenecus arthurdayi]
MPSHGSITKAGKVRSQTPKIEARPKKGVIPRIRNRYNFTKRILEASSSQASERI